MKTKLSKNKNILNYKLQQRWLSTHHKLMLPTQCNDHPVRDHKDPMTSFCQLSQNRSGL